MGSEKSLRSQKERTFIEEARRAQIVTCAIEVISEFGYRKASLVRIAERAGVSKGVILYHFTGKGEVIETALGQIYAALGARFEQELADHPDVRSTLAAYIRALVGYMRDNPTHVRVIAEAATYDGGSAEAGDSFDPGDAGARWRSLADLLRAGQAAGEFRDFDARVLAQAIGGAIDAVIAGWLEEPDTDLTEAGEQLVTTFDRALVAVPPTTDSGSTPCQ
ncbi:MULTISPECIES: TetR/AcrR family transcriptional regulator [Actinoalloteichus]|uniref:Transcriptional regulator, TetR family n=1 Tax=Actinoalloteichus caeruleus DSM 43889 TaxID=1120930 RepID=A0ABT1JP34_ACTCY|nr:TetR/AcrR family transcriptional regulator [Actinoalloteichus caeruleus]MCP2333901.1 transcriptional regulator, TetR family [Actinoalloteichus caeruleus DSM 43889]